MANYLTTRQISNRLRKLKEEGIPQTIIDELREELKGKNVTQKQMDLIVKEIVKSYEFAQIDPGSAVGTVAAQSIGEPGTQMSLPGNEQVVVKIDNTTYIVPIGVFVDELIEKINSNEPYVIPFASDNELLNISDLFENYEFLESTVADIPPTMNIYVPGIRENGEVKWQKLLQVSKHLPNGELLKVVTRSGRTIIATLAHSFVIRKNNKIVPIKGCELRIGDRIPTVIKLPLENPIQFLPLEMYISKNEFGYEPELTVATSLNAGKYNLYNKGYIASIIDNASSVALKTSKTEIMNKDYAYPRIHHSTYTKIPEKMEIDDKFGWFIGAYLARGSNTGNNITITNRHEIYRKQTIEFAKQLGLNYSTNEKSRKHGNDLQTTVYSILLAKLFDRMCGRSSESKFIPPWVLNTKDTFIGALLRGFFDGSGNIDTEKGMIEASSKSRELRDGICLLLSRLGIFSVKSESNQVYKLSIPARYANIFEEKVGCDIPYKVNKLKKLVTIEEKVKKGRNTYDALDIIPGIGNILEELSSELCISSHLTNKFARNQFIERSTCRNYIEIFKEKAKEMNIDISEKIDILEQAVNSDVIWDEIVKLELIESPTDYVYDFSVSELETFMTAEGLITHNTLQTFHYSGVAEMSVLRGLPRLIEIVDARKNPSTPTMKIHLDKIGEKDEQIAKQVARRIELTTVSNVATSIKHSFAEGCIKIKLEPVLLEDKGIEPETIVKKIQKKRRRIKVEIDPNDEYTIIVTPTKELKFNELPKLAEKVKDIPIKGLKNITRVVVLKNKQGEYYLQSEGSNFSELLRIPGVDPTRCYSSDINQIAETLGIEAARNALIRESLAVMKEQGLDVDKRHVMLVADLMTLVGEVQQIGRHGVSGKKSSVFARAAFEVTVKHLLEAAVHGEHEPLEGITENVIIGQTIALGTGIVDLTMSPNYREFAKEEEN